MGTAISPRTSRCTSSACKRNLAPAEVDQDFWFVLKDMDMNAESWQELTTAVSVFNGGNFKNEFLQEIWAVEDETAECAAGGWIPCNWAKLLEGGEEQLQDLVDCGSVVIKRKPKLTTGSQVPNPTHQVRNCVEERFHKHMYEGDQGLEESWMKTHQRRAGRKAVANQEQQDSGSSSSRAGTQPIASGNTRKAHLAWDASRRDFAPVELPTPTRRIAMCSSTLSTSSSKAVHNGVELQAACSRGARLHA